MQVWDSFSLFFRADLHEGYVLEIKGEHTILVGGNIYRRVKNTILSNLVSGLMKTLALANQKILCKELQVYKCLLGIDNEMTKYADA